MIMYDEKEVQQISGGKKKVKSVLTSSRRGAQKVKEKLARESWMLGFLDI